MIRRKRSTLAGRRYAGPGRSEIPYSSAYKSLHRKRRKKRGAASAGTRKRRRRAATTGTAKVKTVILAGRKRRRSSSKKRGTYIRVPRGARVLRARRIKGQTIMMGGTSLSTNNFMAMLKPVAFGAGGVLIGNFAFNKLSKYLPDSVKAYEYEVALAAKLGLAFALPRMKALSSNPIVKPAAMGLAIFAVYDYLTGKFGEQLRSIGVLNGPVQLNELAGPITLADESEMHGWGEDEMNGPVQLEGWGEMGGRSSNPTGLSAAEYGM